MNNIDILCSLEDGVLPQGFCAMTLPVDISKPRGIKSVGPTNLLALERGESRITYIFDSDDDGIPDSKRTLTEGDNLNHGLALYNNYIYASSDRNVYRWSYDGSSFGDNDNVDEELLVGDEQLVVFNINPDGMGGAPQGHKTRTLEFDDIGRLYVSVGSIGNVDENSHRSRIRRFPPISNENEEILPLDFQQAEVFADGLRNEVGLAFDTHGVLWGVENGADKLQRDDLGGDIHNDNPAEELNRFKEEDAGKHWGYPYCWTEYDLPLLIDGEGQGGGGRGTVWAWPSFLDDGVITDDQCRQDYIPPMMSMQAHSAPLGIVFYKWKPPDELPDICNNIGPFPQTMDGYAFIAFHGSWNRDVPTGYKVVYVPFDTSGNPIGNEPIDLLAHEPPNAKWDDDFRPVDVDFDDCGRLLVSGDGDGSKLVRIQYIATTSNPTGAPTSSPSRQFSMQPSEQPTTRVPSSNPSNVSSNTPTLRPSTASPSMSPSQVTSQAPSRRPTGQPSTTPSSIPSSSPTKFQSISPSISNGPSTTPTIQPTESSLPSDLPTASPTLPSSSPIDLPATTSPSTANPTDSPTASYVPSTNPPTSSNLTTPAPTFATATPPPTRLSISPTLPPTASNPTEQPTPGPTTEPTSLPSSSLTSTPDPSPTPPPTGDENNNSTPLPTNLPTSSLTSTTTTSGPTLPPTPPPTSLPTRPVSDLLTCPEPIPTADAVCNNGGDATCCDILRFHYAPGIAVYSDSEHDVPPGAVTYTYVSNGNYVLVRVQQLWKNNPNATISGDDSINHMKIIHKPCDSCPVCFKDEGDNGDGIAAYDFVTDGTITEFEACCIDDYATMIVVVKDAQSNSCNANPYGICDEWPSTQDQGHSLYRFEFECSDATTTPPPGELPTVSPSVSIIPTNIHPEANNESSTDGVASSTDPTPTISPTSAGAKVNNNTEKTDVMNASTSSVRSYPMSPVTLFSIFNLILL